MIEAICFLITNADINVNDHRVTFDSNGGSFVSDQIVLSGKQAVKPNINRSGYQFEGWYLDLQDYVPYDFTTTFTNDITIYAHWRAQGITDYIPNTQDTSFFPLFGFFSWFSCD